MGNSDRAINEADFLELFYPIHYKIGMTLEDHLRAGRLTRKQVAILWLIRSEGHDGRSMPRRDIQRLLGSWFEISNPTFTKSLQAMSRPPRDFVKVVAMPHSRRDKQVVLTPAGEQFVAIMVEHGRNFMRPFVQALSSTEIRQGYDFLRNISATHDRLFSNSTTSRLARRLAPVDHAAQLGDSDDSQPSATTDRGID
jgi:DNA-binding MarR family transcriptional regulator